MALRTFCLLLVVAECGLPVRAEKFTALANVELILHAENTVSQRLRQYIQEEESRLQKLLDVADDFESHSSEALADPDKHLSNPLNSFLLVKRFSSSWDRIKEELLLSDAPERFMSDVSDKTDLFPDKEDLDGAIAALMRLQDTYALPTSKIADGELQGVHESRGLNAGECFDLGQYAYTQEDYYHTVLWMQEALNRWEKEDNPKSVDKATILDYLAFAVSMQGNTKAAYNLTLELLQLQPNHVRAQRNARYTQCSQRIMTTHVQGQCFLNSEAILILKQYALVCNFSSSNM